MKINKYIKPPSMSMNVLRTSSHNNNDHGRKSHAINHNKNKLAFF